MMFTNNKTDIKRLNLETKISQFESCLTLMEKVTVVKKCASKTIFCTYISAKPTKVYNSSNRKDNVLIYMGQ